MARKSGTYLQSIEWIAGKIAEGEFKGKAKVGKFTLVEWYAHTSVAETIPEDEVKADVVIAVAGLLSGCHGHITALLETKVKYDKYPKRQQQVIKYEPLYLYVSIEEAIEFWKARLARIKLFLRI